MNIEYSQFQTSHLDIGHLCSPSPTSYTNELTSLGRSSSTLREEE